MKKGFTMIELIFVIVILGILAAVAVPKLAATRDDAKVAALQTDINTFTNAIPAWYAGQKDARIAQAVSIDTKQWSKGTGESYTLTIAGDTNPCAQMAVWEMNGTTASDNSSPTIDSSTGKFTSTITNGVPVLRIIKPSTNAINEDVVCKDLWTRVSEQNITMGGKKVQW